MADKDFFDKDVAEENQEETEGKAQEKETEEKIKVGDDEFSKDELRELVGLGKIGKEAEEKYQTKIDKVWPEFTKKSQKLKELEEQISKREEEETRTKVTEGRELSADEQRKIAREEAKKLGILLDDDFDNMYAQRRAAERLTEDTDDVVSDAVDKYGIKTSTKELLEHMAETGIRNPERALKDKFED